MPVLSTVGAASLRSFGFGLKGAITPAPSPEPPPPPPVSDFIVATGGSIYVDPYNANYKIHQWTSGSSNKFTVTSCPANPTVEVMVVGGGGSGEYAGGGAGGYVYASSWLVSLGDFLVQVGGGGTNYQVPAGNSLVQGLYYPLVALAGGTASPGASDTFQSGGSGSGGSDNEERFKNGGAGLQPTSTSGGFGNRGNAWFGTGSNGGGGGAGSTGSENQGGSGIAAQICSSSGLFETVCRGGWGTKNGVAYALPAENTISSITYGDGGWGGKMNDANGNYLAAGAGKGGIVRIRYRFQ